LVVRPADCRGCGGAGRAFVSIMIETIIAGLLAPVMMLFQSGGVASILVLA
jgi:membrane glycosyltransferase